MNNAESVINSNKIDVKKTLNQIAIGSYLENTQMLFSFMEELSIRWKNEEKPMYDGKGGLARRNIIFEKLWLWLAEKIRKSKSGELYQNPLSGYIRFYKELFSLADATPEQLAKHIAPMLNYYNVLDYLTNDQDNPDKKSSFNNCLPYCFEDLCLTIMQLTDSDSCSILYCQSNEPVKVVSRNGAVADYNDMICAVNMLQPELDSIIQAYNSTEKNFEYNMTTARGARYKLTFGKSEFFRDCVKGITTISVSAENLSTGNVSFIHDYLVIEFPYFDSGEKSAVQRSFFILLDYKTALKGKKTYEFLPNVLKLLFLRNKLWAAMDQNYSKLIQMKYDFSYIKSLINEEKSEKQAKKWTDILHISDIHLINERQWDAPSGEIISKVKKAISAQANKVDLIAITGDIVSGSSSAADAQEKYSKAATMLKDIAVTLWAQECNGKKILPHDWRLRLLIVPGNHDYSTMSDVVVEVHSRRIRGGSPATCSGGTMSKLTYYIEFLVNLFDVPIDDLLENDMNEIRNYKKLNVIVGLFNSVAKVNSLQTNKVAFNREKLERLIYSKQWSIDEDKAKSERKSDESEEEIEKEEGKKVNEETEEKDNPQRFVLMHHSPEYQIRYFDDKYEYYNYKNVENVYNEYCSLLEKWLDKGDAARTIYNNEFQKFKKQINTDKYDPKLIRTELYADMKTLVKLYEDTLPKDEFYEDFITRHKTTRKMQKSDQKEFIEICEKHIKENDIVLAGHEHKNKYAKTKKDAPAVYVAPKLYDSYKKGVFYSVISEDVLKKAYQTTVYWYDLNGENPKEKQCPCGYFENNQECHSKCCKADFAEPAE